ncbi:MULTISPECIES: tetraacyldisaccharide 4'-kinase [unclassified Rhizobacter]|uniref:tetraacyldisaccharide 4'-kinase n=1 Tax=unclassified Rhizobacter TaxID=2640088 RepID=UPI0006F578CD|nr:MULTISPECIES: tetraacyldisaccharide 4'-kinase [unclassified Rhizobacter]KQU79860.1 tetraacyldisaccharide 4'-kinase [Rhizobacter sp. Root29]KQW02159.1 tetraacyldisaccharide 4'-kinase [Rhizobacter sp. Root1238]KRB19381.1 tetraacyldisaccharide 4'-kinase [Rhizobacter sp. Root16D2]
MSLSLRLQRAWLARGALAWALLPLAGLYGAVIALRDVAFRAGWRRIDRLPVPVIVVGNLIAGGAGKTPTCLALVDLLRQRGWTPGIVSRGYGGNAGDAVVLVTPDTPSSACGDEPLLMQRRSEAPVAVGRRRAQAGRTLLAAHPAVDVIVCDDGLQHRQLARDAQVIVFDERGAGNGWLLPAGPLREPMPSTLPARSVLLYNAPAASTPLPGHVAQRRLGRFTPLQAWLDGRQGDATAGADLRGRRLVAAAGLAHPQRFFSMLRDAGLDIAELPLPDHHDFAALPWPTDTADVVVTEKDAVKLDPARLGMTRVWVATLDFQLPPAFAADLLALLPKHAPAAHS